MSRLPLILQAENYSTHVRKYKTSLALVHSRSPHWIDGAIIIDHRKQIIRYQFIITASLCHLCPGEYSIIFVWLEERNLEPGFCDRDIAWRYDI